MCSTAPLSPASPSGVESEERGSGPPPSGPRLNGIVHDSVTWGFLDTDCSTYSQLVDLIGKEQSLNLVRAAVKTLVGVGLVADDVRQGQGGVPFEFVVDKSLLTPEPTPGPARGRAPSGAPATSGPPRRLRRRRCRPPAPRTWNASMRLTPLLRRRSGTRTRRSRRSAKDEQAIARALGVLGYSADQLVQAMSGIEHVEFFTRKFRPLGLLIKDRDAVQERCRPPNGALVHSARRGQYRRVWHGLKQVLSQGLPVA